MPQTGSFLLSMAMGPIARMVPNALARRSRDRPSRRCDRCGHTRIVRSHPTPRMHALSEPGVGTVLAMGRPLMRAALRWLVLLVVGACASVPPAHLDPSHDPASPHAREASAIAPGELPLDDP